ncbi:MAG: multifunctional CCA tRNA nucleotidyl transferase/2'3'-cyclic phosphodiesterase/2'nucleotidase/phosphatase, partial [Pseudomonadota bacterium]
IPKVAELRPGTILEVLAAADAFHRPERLEALLIVAEADRRGRLGREEEAFPEASRWRQALAAANTVTARDLIASGHQAGPGLAAVLFQRRAEAIRGALSR